MKTQQMFDEAVRHLMAQGKKSRAWTGSCVYRGPNGLKCVIGIFIPDHLYNPSMEGNSVGGLRRNVKDALIPEDIEEYLGDSTRVVRRLKELGTEGKALFFLNELQNIHDLPDNDENIVEVWRRLLRQFARDWGLNDSVLDEGDALAEELFAVKEEVSFKEEVCLA